MSKWFTDAVKRARMKNALVICFHADGCMAHDHKLQWIGRVVSFEAMGRGMEGYWQANIQVLKDPRTPGDIRDWGGAEPPIQKLTVENGAVQEIQPGLFFYYI